MGEHIQISPYDPQWPLLFEPLGQQLRVALGPVALRIDHIGSTAVPNLDAKPILDIQISVASLEPVASYRLPLETLGFLWRADNPDRLKRYFRETPGTRRTHIHVRRAGSFSEQFALLFRDYLRASPQDAAHYAALKYRLAGEWSADRQAYTEAKGPFIWQIMQKADVWAKETGWEPGNSDG